MKHIFISVVTLFAVAGIPASAAELVVTNSADSGAGSLREAITIANLTAGSHTINFDGEYTITLATPLPTIEAGRTITITGFGWDKTIIDGGNTPGGPAGVQAFHVMGSLILDEVGLINCYNAFDGGAVKVENTASFHFLNSRAEANTSGFYGGAVYSEGTAVVDGSLITGNLAYQGGGLYLAGATTIDDTTISENAATNLGGGGITNIYPGDLTVRGSLFHNNQAESGDGGGIQSWAPLVQTTVENSTFVGNTAPSGGGISCKYSGNATLRAVTVTDNQATIGGGISCPDVVIEGSIVYDNTAGSGPDISGTFDSLGYNLIGDVSGTTNIGTTTGNLIGVDPHLGPLTFNGGKTKTRALLVVRVGNAAIDGGPPACSGLTTDQRGYTRPVDGDASGTDECDIGAFEVQDWIFADDFESRDTSVWSLTVN